MREEGGLLIGWEKQPPNLRCVIELGRLSTSLLNLKPKVSFVSVEGRLSTG